MKWETKLFFLFFKKLWVYISTGVYESFTVLFVYDRKHYPSLFNDQGFILWFIVIHEWKFVTSDCRKSIRSVYAVIMYWTSSAHADSASSVDSNMTFSSTSVLKLLVNPFGTYLYPHVIKLYKALGPLITPSYISLPSSQTLHLSGFPSTAVVPFSKSALWAYSLPTPHPPAPTEFNLQIFFKVPSSVQFNKGFWVPTNVLCIMINAVHAKMTKTCQSWERHINKQV